MKHSEALSKKQSPKTSKIPFFILVVSVIGFFDALYLTINHFTNSSLECLIFTGCDTVTKSQYAYFLGIPVAAIGAVYYFTVIVLSYLYFETKNSTFLKIALFPIFVSFLGSVWFVYVQAFILKAFCTYCMLSALSSLTLAILGIFWIKRLKYTDQRD